MSTVILCTSRRLNLLGVAAWLILYGGLALAQRDADEAEAMFRRLDANRDSKLTLDDATDGNRRLLENILEMAGKEKSGSVSRTEFQTAFEKHRAGGRTPNPSGRTAPDRPANAPQRSGLPAILRQLDSDGNQRLSKAELNRLNQLFDRLDANSDGQLDSTELEGAASEPTEPAPASEESRRPNPRTERNSERSTSRENRRPARKDGDNENSLNGVWRGWVVEGRGENPNQGQMELELTIEGDRVTGRELGTNRAPGGLGGGTYVIDGDGKSGNMDADGNSGPQDGRHFQGIYERDGNTLRWCVSNRGRQRPRALASGQGNYLMVLRKQE